MVSEETGLAGEFDVETGRNVAWTARLGSETYASPVVAGGRVYIGTNNNRPRDPRHRGDRGVLMCLDEKDGSLVWQLVVPKITGDVYLDWPAAGLCSPPTVEGERVYVVTNRGEVVCLDARGMADGNNGPYRDEARHATPRGEEPVESGPLDADIIWLLDMREEVGMYPHDTAHASILIDGPLLYLNTGNGVDNTHRRIRAPDAPSLIVLDKASGRLVARDAERIGPRILHCTWASPGLGTLGGARLILYAGADGVCYAFRALPHDSGPSRDRTLERVWRFDCDPEGPKENVHRYMRNRREGPSTIHGMPVLHKGRLYVAGGGDVWWGKREAWLKCIDPTPPRGGDDDVTRSAEIWSYDLNRHTCSTPSVAGGLVFVADCYRTVHCVDAATGKAVWTHNAEGEIWGSTMVADGKVYIGTRSKTFWVLAAARTKRVISRTKLDSGIAGSPTVANGRVYIPTMRTLYAFEEGARGPAAGER
jgi:outer membrane protein assembly factor BamB